MLKNPVNAYLINLKLSTLLSSLNLKFRENLPIFFYRPLVELVRGIFLCVFFFGFSTNFVGNFCHIVGMINKEVIPKYLWKLFKMKVLFMIIRPYSESCIQSVKSLNVLLSGIVCFAPYVVKRSVKVTSNVYLFNFNNRNTRKRCKICSK